MEKYKVIGKELSNDQAYGKVTGRVRYCSDMQSLGMLHMRLKAGTVAHGIIRPGGCRKSAGTSGGGGSVFL